MWWQNCLARQGFEIGLALAAPGADCAGWARHGAGIGARLECTEPRQAPARPNPLSGYLSGDSSRAHFGFPADAALERLSIVWNDGMYSEIDDLSADTLVTVTRY